MCVYMCICVNAVCVCGRLCVCVSMRCVCMCAATYSTIPRFYNNAYIYILTVFSSYCVGNENSIKGFLEQFSDSFMEDACAEEVAPELEIRHVISKRVETKIERALDPKDANRILYKYLYY